MRAFLIVPALMVVLPPRKPPAKMTDAQAEAFARQAITLQDPAEQKAALARLAHSFHLQDPGTGIRALRPRAAGRPTGRIPEGSSHPPQAGGHLASVPLPGGGPDHPGLPVHRASPLQGCGAPPQEGHGIGYPRGEQAPDPGTAALDPGGTGSSGRRTAHREDAAPPRRLQALRRGPGRHPGSPLPGRREGPAKTMRKDLQTLYPSSRMPPGRTWPGHGCWAPPGTRRVRRRSSAPSSRRTRTRPKRTRPGWPWPLYSAKASCTRKKPKPFPPQKLLAEIRKSDRKGDKARKALLVELRLHMNQAAWKEAVDTATKCWRKPPIQREGPDPGIPSRGPALLDAATPGQEDRGSPVAIPGQGRPQRPLDGTATVPGPGMAQSGLPKEPKKSSISLPRPKSPPC